MNNSEIDNLISLLSRLPGIGPRSARRMALNLLKQPESLMKPLADSLGRDLLKSEDLDLIYS